MNGRDSDRASGRPGRSSPPTMTSALAALSSASPFLSAPSPHRSGALPLHLTARFLSLPDVQIDIPDPSCVTVVGLKTLIRQQLVRKAAQAAAEPPSPTSSSNPQPKEKEKERQRELPSSSPTLQDAHRRRLRIIYAGKILADDVILGSVLRPLPPPPRAGRSTSVSTSAASTPVGNQSTNSPSDAKSGTGTNTPLGGDAAFAGRVYVNCSIGDIMPASELSAEADAAAVAAVLHSRGSGAALATSASGTSTPGLAGGRSGVGGGPMRVDPFHRRGNSGGSGGGGSSSGGASSSFLSSQQHQQYQHQGGQSAAGVSSDTTTPTPRGFERLLQAGFTSAEVNQLRLQFNTIQSTRFTPDTMPSPDSLRTMEDNWLDNNQGGGPGGGGGGAAGFGGAGGAGGPAGDDGNPLPEDTGLPGMLDIMVRAMVIGFVFPLGSMSWLMREEGLWTPRWRMFVSMGVVVSLMIGSVKTLAGEW
ncbi:hypothetical protein SCUCBS95973_003798 [Sporothrix curviconia]|uniref:Ubiquitin-like domain-containing protein n=1 Tax=Sporothrix curviconia TaxID=1260050 RepID=A0ABP0BIC5_9PEZI